MLEMMVKNPSPAAPLKAEELAVGEDAPVSVAPVGVAAEGTVVMAGAAVVVGWALE